MEDSKELIKALESLERERNISVTDVLKTIEESLVSALRKHIGKSAQIAATMDPETGEIKAIQHMKIVDFVVSPETEIDKKEAKKYVKSPKIDDIVDVEINIKPFSRIAAQIAKQVLIQKIRDNEREMLYTDFKPREGEVITGIVRRFSDRDIIVDIGKAEGLLPYCEQIRKERYNQNGRVKGIILKVLSHKDITQDETFKKYRPAINKMDKGQKGPYIIISRSAPEFLKKLFEVEVPEVSEGVIEIMAIEREAGYRAKVIVKSNDIKIDPIGACVGMRGIRIRSVTNELSGEKIDLISHTLDAQQLVANSLSPAKVLSVQITNKENQRAMATVADDQLAIAIGRDWQNVKLASRISGWEIEIKGETEAKKAGQTAKKNITEDLLSVDGIGPKTAEVLIAYNLTDIGKIAGLTPEYLSTLQGIGQKIAEKIIEGAKKYIAEKQPKQQSEQKEAENVQAKEDKEEEKPKKKAAKTEEIEKTEDVSSKQDDTKEKE